jgi:predicted NBD/HSP70 family sugar kinase
MKKTAQHLIAQVPRRQARAEMTIGIDLGDVWSHYCTLNQDGEVVDRARFRTTPKATEK